MDVHVRGIDPETWKAMRVEALRREVPISTLIEALWTAWECAVPHDRDDALRAVHETGAKL